MNRVIVEQLQRMVSGVNHAAKTCNVALPLSVRSIGSLNHMHTVGRPRRSAILSGESLGHGG